MAEYMSRWCGLTTEQVNEIGRSYKFGLELAYQMSRQQNPDNPVLAKAAEKRMRHGLRVRYAQQLRTMGCPDSETEEWLIRIASAGLRQARVESGVPLN